MTKVEMKIPPGTKVDTKLLMRGKGIKVVQNRGFKRKGDQIVHLQVEIPKKVSARQEELLREFDEISRGSVVSRIAAKKEGFFSSLFGSEKGDDGEKKKEGEAEEKNAEEEETEIKNTKEETNNDSDKLKGEK